MPIILNSLPDDARWQSAPAHQANEAARARDCEIQCGPECAWLFGRIRIFPQIVGGARIEWLLHPQFGDPPPYTFQLQVGRTGSNTADDWEDVGLPVTDTFYAIDSLQRVHGKFQWTHYRVLLTTVRGSYASQPQPVLGNLGHRDWLRAREIMRLETLRFRYEAATVGYLLKRRLYGELCNCLDTQTGEVLQPQHLRCYGTGFVGGYFEPVPCFYVEPPAGSLTKSRFDQGGMRGTVDDATRYTGRMINLPQVHSWDVWVEQDTDQRWVIRSVDSLVEIRGQPIVIAGELRLLPFSDCLYQFPIPGQVPT